jgi:hypothetical protein
VASVGIVYVSGDNSKDVTDVMARTDGEVVETADKLLIIELKVVISCDRFFSERCTRFDRSLH